MDGNKILHARNFHFFPSPPPPCTRLIIIFYFNLISLFSSFAGSTIIFAPSNWRDEKSQLADPPVWLFLYEQLKQNERERSRDSISALIRIRSEGFFSFVLSHQYLAISSSIFQPSAIGHSIPIQQPANPSPSTAVISFWWPARVGQGWSGATRGSSVACRGGQSPRPGLGPEGPWILS